MQLSLKVPTCNHSKQILIGNFEKRSHVLYMSRFCSQVVRTTPNVLNFDANIVNIALIAFCSLAVTKLTHWPMSGLLSCGSLANSLLQLLFVLVHVALIEFFLKKFLSFFDFFMPNGVVQIVTLAEFGTLAEFDMMTEYSFGLLDEYTTMALN